MSNLILEKTFGVTALGVMDDCYKYGLIGGCDVDCPVLRRGECELQDSDNKELYAEYLDEVKEIKE